MQMSWIDWTIIGLLMTSLTIFSISTFRYTRSVADFLTANRSAGRYLLGIAGKMSGFGAVSVVATFEVYYAAGFPPIWWQLMKAPLVVVITMTGWVYYRFRQSRCLTTAQFYEVRYSKATRIYAGLLTWISGVINFGIFPAVASRFFIYFCGLPQYPVSIGVLELDLTFAVVMALTLGLAVLYTCLGGQITVMVTDCVQGIVTGMVLLLVVGFLLYTFAWSDMVSTLMQASPGKSMINPFDTGQVEHFDAKFYLIDIFSAFYIVMTWQGGQAYNTSGINAHEQKMGQIIGTWQKLPETLLMVLIPICALAFLNLESFATEATEVHEVLDTIDNPKIMGQVRVPVALSYMLPVGLKGLFCAIMLFYLVTTQDTYLHSWGSIFIQDVVLPFRKEPFTPDQHIRLLRLSIVGVAVFAFFFGLLFLQTTFIYMFFAITAAIISGTGAMLIGGLYWKRGTTAGAMTALTVGWMIPVTQMIIEQVVTRLDSAMLKNPGLVLQQLIWITEVNEQYIWFWTMVACIAGYILVSLATSARPININQLLHRGKYALGGVHVTSGDAPKSIWWKIFGMTREFTRADKFLAAITVGWSLVWFAIFVIGTIYDRFFQALSMEFWSWFWHLWIWLNTVLAVPITVWLMVQGIKDVRRLFRRLRTAKQDLHDDGMVVERPSLDK